MRRHTITALLLPVLAATILLSGCGSAKSDYALITDTQGVGHDHTVAAAWNGMCDYAASKGSTAIHLETDPSDETYGDTFSAARKAGAKTVVGVGRGMESVFYDQQLRESKTRFVLIGGVTRKDAEEKEMIAENTICIDYAIEEQAFLCGYAAVTEGYRDLGFMAGVRSESARLYEGGYVRGVQAACEDLGIAAGNVKVKVQYAGSDELTPVRMGTALAWYDAGTEVIATVGTNIRTAVSKAAEARAKKVIAVDSGDLSESPVILFGTAADSESAVRYALSECDKEDFTGGVIERYGAKEESILLIADYTTLTKFTEENYQSVYARLADGTFTAYGEEVLTDLPLVQVIANDEDE